MNDYDLQSWVRLVVVGLGELDEIILVFSTRVLHKFFRTLHEIPASRTLVETKRVLDCKFPVKHVTLNRAIYSVFGALSIHMVNLRHLLVHNQKTSREHSGFVAEPGSPRTTFLPNLYIELRIR